jgi:hypothetical protein
LNQKGVATFMVLAQHGVIGREMQPPVEVSYLADSVLLLRYFEVQGELGQSSTIHFRNFASSRGFWWGIHYLTLKGC